MRIPTLATLSALVLATVPTATTAARAADPAGTWLTQDERGRVRLERCGPGKADLCGYVVWIKDPNGTDGKPRTDTENPDAAKRSRPLLGHELMTDLKPNDDGGFEGKVYNADNGKLYSVTVWSDEVKELSVKGCLISYVCKTQTWTRVTDVPPGQLKGAVDAAGGPRSDRGAR